MARKDNLSASRLRLALDMFATGEAIMRQNLRRRYPTADSAELERLLIKWLRDRPGAPHGDACGRSIGLDDILNDIV